MQMVPSGLRVSIISVVEAKQNPIFFLTPIYLMDYTGNWSLQAKFAQTSATVVKIHYCTKHVGIAIIFAVELGA